MLLDTFFTLLDVMLFFDHYHSKNIDKALAVSGRGCTLRSMIGPDHTPCHTPQVMSALGLLPLQAGETVEQKVAAFRSYQDEVRLPSHLHTLTLSHLHTLTPTLAHIHSQPLCRPPPRSTTACLTSCWPP